MSTLTLKKPYEDMTQPRGYDSAKRFLWAIKRIKTFRQAQITQAQMWLDIHSLRIFVAHQSALNLHTATVNYLGCGMMGSNVGFFFTKTCIIAIPYELLVLLDEVGFNHQNTFNNHAQMHIDAISGTPVVLKHELVEDG
ncbi:hypothetical protein M8C21_027173 [Ambrosia artemisiifolia]|uniref:Uncharacterized protein n=1 Tax=Ambrosia artemisiifolia TaxID=4212 RepID=A0AAD5BQT3_AMBAR|nr:hypothetical protein M8C21_027173 [Ambrosia artemisiifolia]